MKILLNILIIFIAGEVFVLAQGNRSYQANSVSFRGSSTAKRMYSFSEIPRGSLFYFPNDIKREYLWKKENSYLAHNLKNDRRANINGNVAVVLVDLGGTIGGGYGASSMIQNPFSVRPSINYGLQPNNNITPIYTREVEPTINYGLQPYQPENRNVHYGNDFSTPAINLYSETGLSYRQNLLQDNSSRINTLQPSHEPNFIRNYNITSVGGNNIYGTGQKLGMFDYYNFWDMRGGSVNITRTRLGNTIYDNYMLSDGTMLNGTGYKLGAFEFYELRDTRGGAIDITRTKLGNTIIDDYRDRSGNIGRGFGTSLGNFKYYNYSDSVGNRANITGRKLGNFEYYNMNINSDLPKPFIRFNQFR